MIEMVTFLITSCLRLNCLCFSCLCKMCEKTWTVIQFEEDCSVEAVPSIWIQGQFCHWPTYSREKLMTAIKKHESLNTCWPSYKIRSFRNSTFGEFLYLK